MDSCREAPFHDNLASDKTLESMPVTAAQATKEPDIAALQLWDNPVLLSEGDRLPLVSLVVVEIKRPMRNDATSDDRNPMRQTLVTLFHSTVS